MNVKFPKFSLLITVLAIFSFLLAVNPVNGQERKMPQGSKAIVRNDYGSITITGWDGDTIEAVVRDDSRAVTLPVRISENQLVPDKIFITAEPDKRYINNKIKLEIKLPRYAELEPIKTESDSITISGINGFVNAKTTSGNIKITNVGSAQVRTVSGNINLENINGRTDLITTSGNVNIDHTTGGVRITSAIAKINLSCVKERVEIADTSSQIQLAGIEGDVDVSTFSGKTYFTGAIRSGNRYRLKAFSGTVSMAIPDNIGFTVVLSSYSGQIEKSFDLQYDSASSVGKKEQRLTGKYGDGKAQIELDSFNGRVSFSKIEPPAVKECKPQTKD